MDTIKNVRHWLSSKIFKGNQIDHFFLYCLVPKLSKKNIEDTVEKGTRLCLESFQYPILNKQLSYYLLDAILEELFQELVSQK